MYDTSNFLRRVAERFTVNVSESTISETENLLSAGRDETQEELVSIPFIVDMILAIISEISVGKSQDFIDMPRVKASGAKLYDCFYEIFENVKQHASTKSVFIDSRTDKHFRIIHISNPSDSKHASMTSYGESSRGYYYERGVGLDMIRRNFANEGIHVETTDDGNAFTVNIFIPLSNFGTSGF
jgi:hypothetical protein